MSLLLQDTLVISPATVQRIDAEIEEIKNNTDVADVVADKAELDAYDTSRLTDNAIIKVLQDESVSDASTYYRYIKSSNTFELIGSVGPYYTKAESNDIEAQIRQDFAAADTTLQNNITAEEIRATGVENQLRTDLTVETTRATGKEIELNTAITTHTSNTSNPHNVTKAQVGLGNVDNTSDANKPISTATQTALNSKVDKVTTASQVYGTDTQGNQTTYNKDDFGKVDDVQVNGISVVANKIANITIPDPLPNQTGNTGKFLTTDGTDASWEDATSVTFRTWGANE